MSEGTMQRPAERDRHNQRDRWHRSPARLAVCALALPVLVLTAGCSSDSGSGDGGGSGKGAGGDTSSASGASASPTVQAAAYRKLPGSCAVLSKKTLTSLVPKGAKSGKEGQSDDTATRASCSWSSLDNNGVKGSQFRWLNVSLLRFDSDAQRGEGDKLAHTYYEKQVKDAQGVEGAKNTKTQPVAGTGDEASLVRYDLKKKEGAFRQQTIVTRVENVVITLDYNGAGLAGEKTPSAEDLTKSAEKAAKEAVASVASANGDGSATGAGSGTGSGSDSGAGKPSPSTSASKSASAKPSASASKAQKSSSPSASASASKKS
ncbi:DUF3558 domain-containing protein [Streptomyces sp. VMFN-G11Ma]|uniref:DUF3558 domain-containing protein n=1 Tax=Streptomyces sp. VMFN-G11Ma TaxID=2135609 RepID=UPI000D36C28B|nr:DUF3558 domain-containing protein [Streptomyces sp. VMFN-G11Ma]PTM88872.1 uncharacterized protein DUF3558 [Streptomyces sp. VMFN-G11Ma]